jgi:hypothetical protein
MSSILVAPLSAVPEALRSYRPSGPITLHHGEAAAPCNNALEGKLVKIPLAAFGR